MSASARDDVMRRLIGENRRALVGLAHYDAGAKVPGCDCCYCTGWLEEFERGVKPLPKEECK